jgi:hypothetical protein
MVLATERAAPAAVLVTVAVIRVVMPVAAINVQEVIRRVTVIATERAAPAAVNVMEIVTVQRVVDVGVGGIIVFIQFVSSVVHIGVAIIVLMAPE